MTALVAVQAAELTSRPFAVLPPARGVYRSSHTGFSCPRNRAHPHTGEHGSTLRVNAGGGFTISGAIPPAMAYSPPSVLGEDRPLHPILRYATLFQRTPRARPDYARQCGSAFRIAVRWRQSGVNTTGTGKFSTILTVAPPHHLEKL